MTELKLRAILKGLVVSTLALALSSCSSGSNSTTSNSSSNLSSFSGSYVFSVTGTDPTDGDYSDLGRFVADGKGGIVQGVADYNLGSGIDSSVPLTGTYTVASGVASIHLTDGNKVFDNFSTTISTTGSSAISDFDASGSGTLYTQDTTGFSPVGAYSYTLKGEGQGTITGSGNLVTGTGFTFTGGTMSYMDGATLQNYSVVSGFLRPPQPNGRGQGAIVGNNLAYYVVGPKQILAIGLDEHSLLLITAAKA